MFILLLKYLGLDFGHPGNNKKVDQKINIKRECFSYQLDYVVHKNVNKENNYAKYLFIYVQGK